MFLQEFCDLFLRAVGHRISKLSMAITSILVFLTLSNSAAWSADKVNTPQADISQSQKSDKSNKSNKFDKSVKSDKSGTPPKTTNATAAQPGKSPKMEKGWVIDQEDRLAGPRTVYVSAFGMRIESKHDKVIFVTAPPDWQVATISAPKRCFYQCSAAKFVNPLSKPIAVVYGVNLASIPLKKKGAATRCGVQATLYETSERLTAKDFWGLDPLDKGSHRFPATAEAIFTESLKIPEPEGLAMIRLYGIPKRSGIPLVFDYKDQDNDFHWHLRTFSVKDAQMSDALFHVPPGYKRVGTPQDVIRGADNEDVLKNLF